MKPRRPHRRWSAERPSLTPDTLSAAKGPQTRETKGAATPMPPTDHPLQPPTSGAHSFFEPEQPRNWRGVSRFNPPLSFLLSRIVDRQAATSVQQCCVLLVWVAGHCAVKVTDQDCVDYARECVRLAGMAENSPELREWLMQTARHWMAAAMHEMEPPEPVAPVATK